MVVLCGCGCGCIVEWQESRLDASRALCARVSSRAGGALPLFVASLKFESSEKPLRHRALGFEWFQIRVWGIEDNGAVLRNTYVYAHTVG